MNERYDQPFYVGLHSGLRHARNGYLPALHQPEEVVTIPPKPLPSQIKELTEEVKRLQALVIDLQNRLNNHIDSAKKHSDERL